MKPLAKAGAGPQIEVWPNRVVIRKKKLFGWNETTIPMRQIVDVSLHKMANKLVIKTETDEYKYAGPGAAAVHKAILENL